MKKFLASVMCVFLLLSATLSANVDDAYDFANEMLEAMEKNIKFCKENESLLKLELGGEYHYGYLHGAKEAYENILKKLNE